MHTAFSYNPAGPLVEVTNSGLFLKVAEEHARRIVPAQFSTGPVGYAGLVSDEKSCT